MSRFFNDPPHVIDLSQKFNELEKMMARFMSPRWWDTWDNGFMRPTSTSGKELEVGVDVR